MYPPEDPDYHPTAVAKNMYLNRIGMAEAQQILDILDASIAAFRVMQIRVLGGAIGDVAPDATAYAHRAAPIMVNIAAFYTTPEDRAAQAQWVDDFAAVMQQEATGAYVNFIGLEPPERIHAAYPTATWERLRRIKKHIDPFNLFSRNQNIVPAE